MDSQPLPRDLLLRTVDALRAYTETSDRVIDQHGAARGVHRTDLRTLSLLMRRQAAGLETTPSELARQLGISSASTTALVDRLVGAGHAERERSDRDRRSVKVVATESAFRDGQAIFAPIARHTGEALGGFSDDELATAIRVLDAATEGLLAAERDAQAAD